MCIGPLSTLMMNAALRSNQINWSSVVSFVRFTQFSGAENRVADLPTMTTRAGARAWQNSSIKFRDSDLRAPQAYGCKTINVGKGSKRGGWSPVGIGNRISPTTGA